MKGRLIVFEGPDGVGKSTLASALADVLRAQGMPVTVEAFPGNREGTLGHLVYAMHHDLKSGLGPDAQQALHVAAHIDAITRTIRPAIEAGVTVILDRFYWSTLAYGRAFGANPNVLDRLVDAEIACWAHLRPDLIFLIDRPTPFRIELSPKRFRRLRALYLEFAQDDRWAAITRIVKSTKDVTKGVAQLTLHFSELPVLLDSPPGGHRQPDLFQGEDLPSSRGFSQSFLRRLTPLVPTTVFASYWYLAAERQRMFFGRYHNESGTLTDDPILSVHRFTNAYRALDRVSQYLIKHVIYEGSQRPRDVFTRTMLFKFFNKVDTWQHLNEVVGEISAASFDVDRLDRTLIESRERGIATFNGAYIMPARSGAFASHRKHRNYLELLRHMLLSELPEKLSETTSLRASFEILRSYPLLGDFLAFQYAIDVNYSAMTNHDENEFVVAGPGARSGIQKCFENRAGLSDADIIRVVKDIQHEAFADLGLRFHDLWGRALHLVDCQNLFCETDKFARYAHPDVQGIGARTRIKQVYRRNPEALTVWFPPKWGLNERI